MDRFVEAVNPERCMFRSDSSISGSKISVILQLTVIHLIGEKKSFSQKLLYIAEQSPQILSLTNIKMQWLKN